MVFKHTLLSPLKECVLGTEVHIPTPIDLARSLRVKRKLICFELRRLTQLPKPFNLIPAWFSKLFRTRLAQTRECLLQEFDELVLL